MLRALEQILAKTIEIGDKNKMGAVVILETMMLENKHRNIIKFYEILNKAKDEARSIRNKPNLDRYIKTVDDLQDLFTANHLWTAKWTVFASHIEAKNILNTLDALADFMHSQNPKIIIEEEFLKDLSNEFTSLYNQILESTLSKDIQRFLLERIENIITAIRKYQIDGTDGLEKAIKSLVSDLVIKENTLKDEDKRNAVFNKVRAWSLGILIWIAPTPCDIIGAVPDIHDFWIPKFEQLRKSVGEVEQIVSESKGIINIQEISSIFSVESQKILCAGEDVKLLPPSKETSEISNS
jgi:hypothetical protein